MRRGPFLREAEERLFSQDGSTGFGMASLSLIKRISCEVEL